MSEFVFSREEVRAVDRGAMEEFGVPGMVLMENAARGLLEAALEMLGPVLSEGKRTPRVLIVAGSGNNGGDGYALARLLHNCGVRVTVMRMREPAEGTDARMNREICWSMKLPLLEMDGLEEQGEVDLIVDALFGTGLDRAVEGRGREVIEWINGMKDGGTAVLAVDIPSGLDCDTGRALGVAVRATRTVTFVGLKVGMLEEGAGEFCGEIGVGDIGVPRELVERLGRPISETSSSSASSG